MKLYTLPHPIIESTFETLRQRQIQDKKELVKLLCKTDKLPSELWIHIVSFINNDDEYEAYLMFLRTDIGFQDTYYFFRGTKANFDESITKLKIEVLERKENFRLYFDDDLLDTPIDTYCPRNLHINNICRNDGKCLNSVNKCCCQWQYYVYDNAEELDTHYKDRIETGKKEAYYRICEIKFI
jgi:hypothetical protein